MAKKKGLLESELENADYMTILAGGGKSTALKKNDNIDYSYPTGIPIIDYAYGYEINVFDGDTFIKKRTILGLQAGSFNVITGHTQSFKTTISLKILANIAYVNNGNIVHYDAEQRAVIQRVKTLTKLPLDWFRGEYPRYSFRSGSIGFDTLQNDIFELYENKVKHRDILLKDTGEVDENNEPIMLMPPTVILIDSLQNVIEKEYDISNSKDADKMAELRSKTQGARSAYTIRGFITDILPMLKEANIIVLCIAHKTANMSLNPFGGVKKQFQYGNNDERISGGSAVEFNASAVINLSGRVGNDTRFHVESDGFEGNTVLFEPTKSSTNESGNEKSGLGFNIIIDKRKEGVDNLRTLTVFLNDKGRLKGNKAGYRVIDKSGEPITERFGWKTMYEDFKNNPDSLNTFMRTAKEELNALISKAPEDIAGTIDVIDMESF